MNITILKPSQQKTWGWPALVNLTVGGAGAGLYLICLLLTIFGCHFSNENQIVHYQLMAFLLVLLGFVSVAFEAGHPFRAYRIFSNLSSSWMSIESLSGMIFMVSVLADWIFPHSLVTVLAATTALVYMISQGIMVYRSVSITAWHVKRLPLLFITSGFTAGCGCFLINTHGPSVQGNLPLIVLSLCIIMNLLALLFYLLGSQDYDFQNTIKPLLNPIWVIAVIGIGHFFPIIYCFIEILFLEPALNDFVNAGLQNMAGIAIIFSGVILKAGLILKAGYHQMLTLNEGN